MVKILKIDENNLPSGKLISWNYHFDENSSLQLKLMIKMQNHTVMKIHQCDENSTL